MDSNKLANWLQVIANFGLLGELILVAMQINQNSDELKQNHLHARAQLIADDYVNLQGHQYTLMGDNPAASVAKAKVTPESLTEEEKIVVDAHMLAHYLILDSYEYIATQTGLYCDAYGKP